MKLLNSLFYQIF